MNEADKLREKIKELTEDLQVSSDRRDWGRCDSLNIQIEETIIELNLLDRSDYYYIEK